MKRQWWPLVLEAWCRRQRRRRGRSAGTFINIIVRRPASHPSPAVAKAGDLQRGGGLEGNEVSGEDEQGVVGGGDGYVVTMRRLAGGGRADVTFMPGTFLPLLGSSRPPAEGLSQHVGRARRGAGGCGLTVVDDNVTSRRCDGCGGAARRAVVCLREASKSPRACARVTRPARSRARGCRRPRASMGRLVA